MRNLLTASLLVFANFAAFASLPPIYDSSEKIKAILDDDRVMETLGSGNMITGINHDEDLTYTVSTDDQCGLEVTLKAIYPNHPGPTKYKVKKIGDMTCANRR